MGFTSQDDLINEITVNGKFRRVDMFKSTTPAYTAGSWHMLTGLLGFPNQGLFPGTDLVWQNCAETSGDGSVVIGPQHAGVVGPADTKHILNVGASIIAAAGGPWQAKLVDLQGYYRLSTTNVTGVTSRVLINSNAVTASSSGGLLLTSTNDFSTLTKVRFTTTVTLPTGLALATDYWLVAVTATTSNVATSLANAIAGTVIAFTNAGTGTHTMMIQMPRYDNGLGCEAFFVSRTQPTAGGPNLSASAYDSPTDTAGDGTRVFQGSPTMAATADAYATRILHSGNAAGRYGAFLPRQAADTGIARINSFTWSGGTAYGGLGAVALCIARPLLDIAISATGVWSERDLVNQLPSMPQVQDGACLQWLLFGTGVTTINSPFTSALDFGWG